MSYRKSNWTFDTGASAAFSLGPAAITRGMIVLDDPAKQPHRFDFLNVGFGLGLARMPKKYQLPEIPLPGGASISGSGATTDFWGSGKVYVNNTFQGSELTIDDFIGAAFIVDLGGGLFIAKGVTVMFVGIPEPVMLAASTVAAFAPLASLRAKAFIALTGVSEGLIDGLGVTGSVGSLKYTGKYSE